MNKYLLITIQIILVFLFWYLLSGKNGILLLVVGALCSLLIVLYLYKITMIDDESLPIKILPKAIYYWVWLYKEMIFSSVYISKLILSPRLSISPQYFKIKSKQKSAMGFNIYANSITLTPGTISVIINNSSKEIDVHSISKNTKASLLKSEMDNKIKKLMGDNDI
jgi:multicomponent Na+:H+ antiporter subunit E